MPRHISLARARGFSVILLMAGCLVACQPIAPAAQGNLTGGETGYTTATEIPIEVETATVVSPEAAVGEVALSSDVSDDQELIVLGMEVYRANYCGVCHRLAAVGTTGAFGPPHDEMGRVAGERIVSPAYGGAARDAAGYIRESIVDPYVYLVPTYEVTQHRMPPYAHLAGEQIDALVAMLLAQE